MGLARTAPSVTDQRRGGDCRRSIVFNRSRYRCLERRYRSSVPLARRFGGAICRGEAGGMFFGPTFPIRLFSLTRFSSLDPSRNGIGSTLPERKHTLFEHESYPHVHRVPPECTRGGGPRGEDRYASCAGAGRGAVERRYTPAVPGRLDRSRCSPVSARGKTVAGSGTGGCGIRTLSQRSESGAVFLRVGQGTG